MKRLNTLPVRQGFITLASLIILLFHGTNATAQPCDLTNSIDINTGYDPVAGAPIAIGASDPNWQVSVLSGGSSTKCGCSPTFQAIAVTPFSAWAVSPMSNWICFMKPAYYNTLANDPGVYTMTLTRQFKTCADDSIFFDLQIANDNYISDLHIDSDPSFFSQPPGFTFANYMTFSHVTQTVGLSAGVHTISITIVNFVEPVALTPNWTGFNLLGTVTSASGSNSIVGPKSSPTCACNCNFLKSLDINTGYDLTTSTVLPTSTPDPNWTVTGLSAGAMAVCGCTPGYPAITVTPFPYWASTSGTNSDWICFVDPAYFNTAANDTNFYSMTITHTFTTCDTDTISVNLNIANDNYVSDMDIDGGPSFFSQTPGYTFANYMTFTNVPYTTVLAPGPHTLNVTVVNFVEPIALIPNWTGVDIYGTIASATGQSSILDPQSSGRCCTSGHLPCDAKVKLTGTFAGMQKNDCLFKCVATTSAGSGWTPVNYSWTTSGGWSTTHTTTATSDTQFPDVSGGTSVIITVTVTFVDAAGDTCIQVATRQATCKNGKGTLSKQGTIDNSGNTGLAINKIEVYPNPATTSVTVSSDDDEIQTVEVFNVSGQRVASYTFSSNKVTFSIEHLPEGSYLIKVNNSISKLINKIK